MNKDQATESLLLLIGELLYKNQLLREAIALRDEVIEQLNAGTSACSCDVANQLEFVRNTLKRRNVELSRGESHYFNECRHGVKCPIDSATDSPWDEAIRAAEK